MSDNIASEAQKNWQAVLLVLVAYLGYSVTDLCSKSLQAAYNINQILALSGTTGAITTGLWLFAGYGARAFIPQNFHLHLLRAGVVLGTAYFLVRALKTLPLADFYGVVFLTPFLVMAMAVMILREKVEARRWLIAAVGFTGVVIIAGPQFGHIGEGFLCALMGAMFSALNIICLRRIGQGAPAPLYGFYPFLIIALFNIGVLILGGKAQPLQAEYIPYFLAHSLSVMTGVICLSLGVSRAAQTAIVAPLQYTQIIWGVLFGWLFFTALPTPTTWAGLALIIGAGLYSIYGRPANKSS